MENQKEEIAGSGKQPFKATPEAERTDRRIAYGVHCTWWDSIYEVGKHPSGLPCCPYCKSMLMEVESIEVWMRGATEYERNYPVPGYVDRLIWSRGKCFRDMCTMNAAFDLAKLKGDLDQRSEGKDV